MGVSWWLGRSQITSGLIGQKKDLDFILRSMDIYQRILNRGIIIIRFGFLFCFVLHKSRYACKYKQQKLINITQVFKKRTVCNRYVIVHKQRGVLMRWEQWGGGLSLESGKACVVHLFCVFEDYFFV